MRDVQCTAKHLWRIRIRHANNQQCLHWDKFLRSKQIGGVTTGIVTFSYWCDTWDWMLKYLFCGLQVFLFSSTFIFLHTHSLTAAEPLFLRASISTGNVRNKQIFAQSFEPERRTEKRKTETNVYEIYCREETPLPSGGSSLSSDLLKAAVFECLRIHLIHFFYNEAIVFQEKKNPCTCTWPNNIALLITSDPEIFRLCRAASTSLLSACSTSIWPLFT